MIKLNVIRGGNEICPTQFHTQSQVALATTIAFALSEGLSSNEVITLGTFLTIIGDDLQYISAHLKLCQTNSGSKQEEQLKASHEKKADTNSSSTDKNSSYRTRFIDCLNDIPDV